LASDAECSAVLDEISALDLVLGPDLDDADEHEEESDIDAAGLLANAIGGIIGLPYSSIVRRLSGAAGRERVLREAIFAGMVRRAFLKGVARTACAPVAPDEAVDPSAAPEASTTTDAPPPSQQPE
jgi:hypothetical protein